MPGEARRTEADDEWLAEHRSKAMSWLRRRFRALGTIGDALSHADMGPYAGAPRNPRLRTDDGAKGYSTVRYATNHVAYTTTSTDPTTCPRCGMPLAERHQLEGVRGEDTHVPVGAVRICYDCGTDSWLLRSRMPSRTHADEATRRNVV